MRVKNQALIKKAVKRTAYRLKKRSYSEKYQLDLIFISICKLLKEAIA